MNRYIQYMYSYPHKTAYRALENVDLRDYFCNLEGEGHSLYLHLPFCESKCGYCNLFSVTGCDRTQMDDYLDAVLRQIKQYRERMPQSTSFEDLTIGGGTPLLLESGQIERVFEAVKTNLPMSGSCRIIIETAPNQTDKVKAKLLKELGVTRVSMGIQSFDNRELRWLGRNHDRERAVEAAELLADTGFECVNFDFIYGLPGQTAESLVHSLGMALSFSPDEIFLYPLYIKHGVRLEREGRKELLDSDHIYALYQCGSAYLRDNGYEQISMRRFLKKGGRKTLPSDSLQGDILREKGLKGDRIHAEEPQGDRIQEKGFQGAASCRMGLKGEGFQGNTCQINRLSGNGRRENRPRENRSRDELLPKFSECGLKSALSLGCGGRSYLGRLHACTPYRTTRNAALEEIARYQRTEDFFSVSNGILLSEDELKRRYVIKNLLILPGISRQAYQRAFQADILTDFPIIKDWIRQGWVEERCGDAGEDAACRGGRDQEAVSRGSLGLTAEGLGLSDYIGPQLISEDIRGKMLEWERLNA